MSPKRYLPSELAQRVPKTWGPLGTSPLVRIAERPDRPKACRSIFQLRPRGRSATQLFAKGEVPVAFRAVKAPWGLTSPAQKVLARSLRDASKWSLKYPKTIIPIFHIKKYLPENFKNALGNLLGNPKNFRIVAGAE